MTPATLHIPKKNITIELTPELESALLSAIEGYEESTFDKSLATPGVKSRLSRLSHALDSAAGR